MKFFGQSNTSTPNRKGFIASPTAGYSEVVIDDTKLDPFGTSYMITLPGIVDVQAPINDVKITQQDGQETVLLIENVSTLPDPLEPGKCYISIEPGFQSTIYIALVYANATLQYKLGFTNSVLTVNDVNAMLPVGKLVLSLLPFEQSEYLKLCNGQTLSASKFPIMYQYISQIPGLAELLAVTDTTFNMPTFQNIYPMLLHEISGINSIIPGGVETRTSIPKAGFQAPHTHTHLSSHFNNSKRNDAAGLTGPQANQASTQRTTDSSTPSIDFSLFQSIDDSKFKVTDTFGGGPYAPFYAFMVVR